MAFDPIVGKSRRAKPRGERVFYTAVVCDFYSNPRGLSDVERADLQQNCINPRYIDRMPRNSISAYIVSDRKGKSRQKIILYPFFSPHISLPVKPGEQVWFIFEKTGNSETLGYWISRKTVDYDVDDINYTHADRMTQRGLLKRSATDETKSGGPVLIPNFPTGATTRKSGRTLHSAAAYEEIIRNASSFKEPVSGQSEPAFSNQFIGEPVPRFSKSVGDVVIQGSNNTSIVLGNDRNGRINNGLDKSSGLSPFPGGQPKASQGSIDIVAGRGQTASTAAAFNVKGIPNTRRYFEISKRPQLELGSGRGDNIAEGDPDFINDLSRIYVSMNTSGDRNCRVNYPNTSEESVTSLVKNSPYVILKTEENRIFSKSTGSIRLVKKGVADEDKSVIMMLSNGTVMIDGPKIIIGSGLPDIEKTSGEGEQVFIGRDAEEPMVLGNKLIGVLSSIIDVLDKHIHANGAGNTGPRIPNPAEAASPETVIGGFSNTGDSITDLKEMLSEIGKLM